MENHNVVDETHISMNKLVLIFLLLLGSEIES